MDGYLKPNFKSERKELHSLSLDECDFVPDDDVILHPIVGSKHSCPRCCATTTITGSDPYCSDCNWDSLTDPTYEKRKCVA